MINILRHHLTAEVQWLTFWITLYVCFIPPLGDNLSCRAARVTKRDRELDAITALSEMGTVGEPPHPSKFP